MAIEVIHFDEHHRGLLKSDEIVEHKTVYLLPKGTSLLDVRRVGLQADRGTTERAGIFIVLIDSSR